MGTSKSYGGPSSTSRLLPKWAQPDTGAPDDGPVPAASSATMPAAPRTAPGPETAPASAPTATAAPSVPVKRPWTAARRSLGSAIRAGGSTRKYGRAAARYVKARGGARAAASSSTSARQSTARFASFLADVVRSGAKAAVGRLGLSGFIGRPIDQLFAALADALAPDGSTNEKATSRRAVLETMTELYEKWGVEDGGLERLDSMSADDMRDAIIEAVGASIFSRWALELGSVIENKAVSTKEAVMIEGEMREYIHGTLRLDLKGGDVTAVDWAGPEGSQIIEKVFEEAYSLIEKSV